MPDTANPFSVFPLDAHRTLGFFKVRGININHAEFEDFIYSDPRINDFKAELHATPDGLDVVKVSIEIRRDVDGAAAAVGLREAVKQRFELTPEVDLLPPGTLAREFESAIKAPRFADRRG